MDSRAIFATAHPNVLITVGNSCPSTQSCLPFSSFNQHNPAIQLRSSSPPIIRIVPAYFTTPAPQRAFGSSGPVDHVRETGSNTSTELTQNSGRNSRFHFSLIWPLPPGEKNRTVYLTLSMLSNNHFHWLICGCWSGDLHWEYQSDCL